MTPQIKQVEAVCYGVYVVASCGASHAFVSFRRDGTVNVVTMDLVAVKGRGVTYPTFGDALDAQKNREMRELLRAAVGPAIEAGFKVGKDFWTFLEKRLDE